MNVSFHISLQNFKSVLEQKSQVIFTQLPEDIYVLNIKMISNQTNFSEGQNRPGLLYGF